MSNKIFNRIEKKYLLSKNQYDSLLNLLKDYIEIDKYGLITISNIYYDTDNYELIRSSIEKPIFKEKLRLRSYNKDYINKEVFIELKKKFNGVVYKRRESLMLNDAYDLLNYKHVSIKGTQIFNEISYFMKCYKIKPVLFLAYERKAFFGKEDEDFRVTFDFNIRSRTNSLYLELGDYGDNYFKDETILMEVKCLGSLPLWFVNVLSELKIYPTTFSKYGNIYKQLLKKEEFLNV